MKDIKDSTFHYCHTLVSVSDVGLSRIESGMVIEARMPKMSQTTEKGKVVKWLRKEGDRVEKGEPLLEIETEKTTIELEARGSGKLRKILVREGDESYVADLSPTLLKKWGFFRKRPCKRLSRLLRRPQEKPRLKFL